MGAQAAEEQAMTDILQALSIVYAVLGLGLTVMLWTHVHRR